MYWKKRFIIWLLETSELLGSGDHGAVFTGTISGCTNEVAVKTTLHSMSVMSAKQLLSEIKILIHIGKHQNTVQLVGAVTAEKNIGGMLLLPI